MSYEGEEPIKKIKLEQGKDQLGEFRIKHENLKILKVNEDSSVEVPEDGPNKMNYYSIFGLKFQKPENLEFYQIVENDDCKGQYMFLARCPAIRFKEKLTVCIGESKMESALKKKSRSKEERAEAKRIGQVYKKWNYKRKYVLGNIRDNLLKNLFYQDLDYFNNEVEDAEKEAILFQQESVKVYQQIVQHGVSCVFVAANLVNYKMEEDFFQQYLRKTVTDYGKIDPNTGTMVKTPPARLTFLPSNSPSTGSSSSKLKQMEKGGAGSFHSFGSQEPKETDDNGAGTFAGDFDLEDELFGEEKNKDEERDEERREGMNSPNVEEPEISSGINPEAYKALCQFLKVTFDSYKNGEAEYSTMQGLLKRFEKQDDVDKETKKQLSFLGPNTNLNVILYEILSNRVVEMMNGEEKSPTFHRLMEITFQQCSELMGKTLLSVANNVSDIHLMKSILSYGKTDQSIEDPVSGDEKFHLATAAAIIQGSSRTLTRGHLGLGTEGIQTKKLKDVLHSKIEFTERLPFDLDEKEDKIELKEKAVKERERKTAKGTHFGMRNLWK